LGLSSRSFGGKCSLGLTTEGLPVREARGEVGWGAMVLLQGDARPLLGRSHAASRWLATAASAAAVVLAVCALAALVGGIPRAGELEQAGADQTAFEAWLHDFHLASPDASLATEKAAWGDRQRELKDITNWEDGMEERMSLQGTGGRGEAIAATGADAPPVPSFAETPATITVPPPGPPDFNGNDAILANHPFMGVAPTELEEKNGETRGSFTVRLARAGYIPPT